MVFESTFKSLGVWIDGKHISFKRGEYETSDKREIEVLKATTGVTVKEAVSQTPNVK